MSFAARPKAPAASRKDKSGKIKGHEAADQKKVPRRDAMFISSSMVRKTTTTSTENVVETYRNVVESTSVPSAENVNVDVEENEMDRRNARMLDLRHNSQQSAWYFVGFENEKRDSKDTVCL